LRRKNDNLEKEAKKLRYQVAHLQDELEKEKKNAQNVMKRRENRMKDMQTQTEEEIKARREDSAYMRELRMAKKAAEDVLK